MGLLNPHQDNTDSMLVLTRCRQRESHLLLNLKRQIGETLLLWYSK